VQSRPLSEADGLNGLLWDGIGTATGTSMRMSHYSNCMTTLQHCLQSPTSMSPAEDHSRPGPWSAWVNVTQSLWGLSIRNTRGQWVVQPTRLSSALYFEPWPCSELPGAQGK